MHNVIDVYNQTALGTITDDDSNRLDTHTDLGLFSPRSWNPAEGQETCWPDYCEVQREIAKKIVENYAEGDLIWIHHYHMMLLPSYVARKIRSANIGAQPPCGRRVCAAGLPLPLQPPLPLHATACQPPARQPPARHTSHPQPATRCSRSV